MTVSNSKYVVGEMHSISGLIEVAVCFGDLVTHSELRPLFVNILGAGFFYLDSDNKVVAFGRSVSLSINSRPKMDSRLIAKALSLNP